jgi:hypothetical protein
MGLPTCFLDARPRARDPHSAASLATCRRTGRIRPVLLSLEVATDAAGLDRTGHPKGPQQRPATKRLLEAGRIGVQVCTSARHAPAGIRHDPGGTPVVVHSHHEAEQVGFGGALPTSDAGANRNTPGMDSFDATDHARVYRPNVPR